MQPAATGPAPSWRRVLALAPLLAVLALLVGLVAAPAATAAPAAGGEQLGAVRHLTVDVDADGAVPLGLDRSTAIRFTDGARQGTCLTDELGWCDVRWTSGTRVTGGGTDELRLPAGTYTVTQVAELAVPGLQPRTGTLATVEICDCWRVRWLVERDQHLRVGNDSLYRHTVDARVVDQVTGAAVPGARYRLTGPGYPSVLGDRAVVDAGVETSDRQGRLTFSGAFRPHVFRPGSWTLTPVSVPTGYLAAPLTVELAGTAPGGNRWDAGTVALGRPVTPPPATGTVTFGLQTAGAVPTGLDLSGAVFELTGPTTAQCTTGALGGCAATALPTGAYSVRQTSAPHGLAPAAELAQLTLCASGAPCAATVPVVNESLFRTTIQALVLAGGEPVGDVDVTLAGDGREPVTATTGADGVATWTGWFLPGDWTFLVAGQPEPVTETLETEPADADEPWLVQLVGPPVEDGGSTPTDAPPATPAPTTPAPPTGAAPTTALPPAAPSAPAADQQAAAVAPQAVRPNPAATPPEAPASGTPSSSAAPSAAPPSTVAAPAGETVEAAGDAPALETESSAQLLSAGAVAGIGMLFLALVVGGYLLLRSRSRRA